MYVFDTKLLLLGLRNSVLRFGVLPWSTKEQYVTDGNGGQRDGGSTTPLLQVQTTMTPPPAYIIGRMNEELDLEKAKKDFNGERWDIE